MIKSIKRRITTSTTTNVIDQSCTLKQLVISIANAGTTWKLTIQDKATTPAILLPETTLAAPTTPEPGAIIKFDEPIYMDGGIDIVTASGTPGVVTVWCNIETSA